MCSKFHLDDFKTVEFETPTTFTNKLTAWPTEDSSISPTHLISSVVACTLILIFKELTIVYKRRLNHSAYTPPSSSESVSESSLSLHAEVLSFPEIWVHTITDVSAPPSDTNFLSPLENRQLVTWALWPTYFLCLANFPYKLKVHLFNTLWKTSYLFGIHFLAFWWLPEQHYQMSTNTGFKSLF